jgi:Ca-activated chloride channel family protein
MDPVWTGAAPVSNAQFGSGRRQFAEGLMTFERPWLLLFALLPVAWAYWMWRRSALDRKQQAGMVLKAASLVAIVAALAEPRLPVAESKSAVAVLADTSASVSAQDLAKASGLLNQLEAARGRNWMRVIPFARGGRTADGSERTRSWELKYTAGDAGRGTDLEAALREASYALPEKMIPRIALISDGHENQGSVTRAAWQAKQLGIPIDVFPLSGRPRPALRVESANVPSVAFAGERFAIEMLVSSPKKTEGELEVLAEGKRLGLFPVSLQAGENRIRAQASITVPGALALSAALRAEGLGEVQLARALTLRRPRALFISQDPDGTEVHLLRTLEAGQFEVRRAASVDEVRLDDAHLVILNNQDLESMPPDRKTALESYVKQGGGLIVIGGERNMYGEKKPGTPEDPLERALPAKLSPPRSPEGTCVVLIIDKSSSMEGRKMELARVAAIGVIENLRPVDLVGVLIFDNSFQWAVPIRKAEDRALIKRLVAGVTPDGGTQIAPALSEAFRRTIPARATFKHIVLLTDGISEEGDSISVAREAFQQRITISTVGLGQDVNRAYLERIANLSKGKAYFLNDPSGLEQILLRDVMEHTGSTAIEKAISPQVVKSVEVLDGVDMAQAPALKGYVKFTSKPTAETILDVPGQQADQRDPLYVRWQYGLGRAAVFASDAKSRWAEGWVNWPGFDRFWLNVLRDLLPHTGAGEVTVDLDPATSELVVDYRLNPAAPEPATPPDIFVFGPDGLQKPLPLQKVASGSYRGKLAIGDRRGLFRIRPLAESRAFPETGFYRDEQELSEYGANQDLLRRVAEFTGGRVNPAVSRVFDSDGRTVASMLELWPALLGAAILMNIAELLLRKWSGLPFARNR